MRIRGPDWMRVLVFSIVLLASIEPARAAVRLHALIIGNNDVFSDAESDPGAPPLVPLRYADDDAAAIASFIEPIASSVQLLTLMDATTQTLYPELVARAKPPTVAAVEAAVETLARAVARDAAQGHQSVVWVFFSGHGSWSHGQGPGLALSDGAITREFLYDRILARVPATYVHLLVDACHAESVVRPRGSHAEVVALPPEVTNAALLRATLARFPNVGAILGSSSDAQTHEWDALGHGVFTYELLSALRGGADVNNDRVLEYSEVYAFMSAANRSVPDSRARLSVVAHAPARNRRAPLLSLTDLASPRLAWLIDISGERGRIEVTDTTGRRLATLHNAADFTASLLLPAGSPLFVSAEGVGKVAKVRMSSGTATRFGDLEFEPSPSRRRGVLANLLSQGLFATRYGRGYYEGFTENARDLVAVPLNDGPVQDGGSAPSASPDSNDLEPNVRVAAGLGGSRAVARKAGTSYGVQLVLGRATGHGPIVAVDGFVVDEGALREWRGTAKVGWSWQTTPAWVRAYGGPRLGAGWILQELEGLPDHSSPLALAGAAVGLLTSLTDGFGAFVEVEGAVQLMQRDDEARLSPSSSAWLGAALEW